jgi:hypothetical protein
MNRTLIASLTITASALVGLAVHEGYCGEACIPVKGDRPTLGFGDAQGVKLGQKTDPVRALIRLNFQAEAFQHAMRQCVGDVPMYHPHTKAAADEDLHQADGVGGAAAVAVPVARWAGTVIMQMFQNIKLNVDVKIDNKLPPKD